SWWPLATTRTAPPPAEPSTRRLASSSCRRAISACIRWTCFIILLKLATPAPSPEGSLFGSVTGVLALHPDHMAPEELHGLADQRILQSLDVDRRRLLALRRPARPPLPGLARGRPLPSGRPHLLGQILLRGDVEPDRAAHLPAEHAPDPVLVGLLAQVGPVKLVALGEDQISIVPLEGGQPGLPGEGVGRPAGGGAVQLGQHPLPEARQIGCLAGRGPSLPARGGRTRPSLLGGWGNGPAPAGGALFPRGRGFGGGGRRRTALLLGQGRRRRGGRRGRRTRPGLTSRQALGQLLHLGLQPAEALLPTARPQGFQAGQLQGETGPFTPADLAFRLAEQPGHPLQLL